MPAIRRNLPELGARGRIRTGCFLLTGQTLVLTSPTGMDTTARFERAVRSFAGCCLTGLGYVVMVRDRRFELRILRVRTETIPDVSLSRDFYGR